MPSSGQWIESGEGAVVGIDRYYAADRSHGRERIGDVVDTLEAGADALGVLARAWPARPSALDSADTPRDAGSYGPTHCFFDLETTGIAGGAGTQAFLVGCASGNPRRNTHQCGEDHHENLAAHTNFL